LASSAAGDTAEGLSKTFSAAANRVDIGVKLDKDDHLKLVPAKKAKLDVYEDGTGDIDTLLDEVWGLDTKASKKRGAENDGGGAGNGVKRVKRTEEAAASVSVKGEVKGEKVEPAVKKPPSAASKADKKFDIVKVNKQCSTLESDYNALLAKIVTSKSFNFSKGVSAQVAKLNSFMSPEFISHAVHGECGDLLDKARAMQEALLAIDAMADAFGKTDANTMMKDIAKGVSVLRKGGLSMNTFELFIVEKVSHIASKGGKWGSMCKHVWSSELAREHRHMNDHLLDPSEGSFSCGDVLWRLLRAAVSSDA
jgi:hypothetical protein